MIFRKPYAFLIKNFRLVHVLLALISVFVCYRTGILLDFFNDYLDKRISILGMYDAPGQYLGIIVYFVAILVLAMCVTVLVLMKRKEKPSFLYILLSIFYAVLIVGFIFTSSTLSNMVSTNVDIRVISGLKDFLTACYYMQYGTIVLIAIRATGFDIKKFDFGSDAKEIAISEEDNEEFDVALEFDTEDMKAKLRKRMRIIRYVYKENKLVFFVFGFMLFASISIVGFNLYFNKEKVYAENEIFKSYSYELKVLDSYKAVTGYNNVEVLKDKGYIIVKLNLKNIVDEDRVFDINNARIRVDGKGVFLPVTNRYDYFQDLGKPYHGASIDSDVSMTIMLVYELPKEYIYDELYFEYFKDELNGQYIYDKVKISPKEFGEERKVASYGASLNEELQFIDSIYPNSNITINAIEIKNKYTYRYDWCVDGKCNTSTRYLTAKNYEGVALTVMKINYSLNIDGDDIGYDKGKFIENFGKIRYVSDGKEFVLPNKLTDITPFYVDNYSFVEVTQRLNYADKIYIDFRIRDKMYSYAVFER